MQWVLTTYNSETQTISPEDADGLQVEFGSGDGLLALPANNYVWAVRGSDGVYTFVFSPTVLINAIISLSAFKMVPTRSFGTSTKQKCDNTSMAALPVTPSCANGSSLLPE